MAETDFIVAIELGSSKITGIAGKKNSDGSLHVLACASEDSSSFIRKGVIYNLNKTAQSLTSIINRLEGALDATIAKVYVGISGQSLRSIKNTIVRHLSGENTISQELVDAINDDNRNMPLIDLQILDVAPQEYRIGNNFQLDPVGVFGNNIEGRFLNIIARSSVKKNLEKCFDQANIEVADYFISPIALGNVVLSDIEKRSGCALVDIGADTTTVSVYKNNILRHLAVIPLGGNSITKDIANLQIEESEAERLKINYGNAINDSGKEGEEQNVITLNDRRTIEESLLNDIIEARTEEIIANIWNQIQLSGYESQLLAGVIFTGGGANLRSLEEAFRKKTRIEKTKIVKSIYPGVRTEQPDLLVGNAMYNTILGLLYAGEYNCCKPEEPKPLSDLFKDEMESKNREEEKKRKEEEEEKERERKRKEKEDKQNKAPKKLNNWLGGLAKGLFEDNEMK